jgi:hypothetical protein
LIEKSSEGWTEASALLEQFEDDPTALKKVSEILVANAYLEEQAFRLLA